MIKGKNNSYLTSKECEKIIRKLDFDKLFDDLMTEYKRKNNNKKTKMILKRKEK